MTAPGGSGGAPAEIRDVLAAIDDNLRRLDDVAGWAGALDRAQRDELRSDLHRMAAAIAAIARAFDEVAGRAAVADRRAHDPAGPQEAPWFEALARGLATGDAERVRGLAQAASVDPGIAAGIAVWLDEASPTRDGELLHLWAQLRAAPGWPAADSGAAVYEAPLIAWAYEARLYALTGLGWLADDATAQVERLGPRTLWAQLARAARDLDRGELDDAEASYQTAAMRWPASPESHAGLAAIAEARGFWTDAQRSYEHIAGLCAPAPVPLDRLRAALFWVRSTRRASADATGALVALANHPQLRADRPLRRRALELAIAGDCPAGAPWLLDARVALAELLERDADPAAGRAFADVASSYLGSHHYERAVQFSRRAIAAGKTDAVAYWTLADDLRLCDLSEPGRVEEAVAVWQSGFALERPSHATWWALLARAMLGDVYRGPDRAEQVAAAVFHGEWAAAMVGDSAVCWAYLARFYRTVNADCTALALVERAAEQAPASTLVRDEHAAALASVGRSREALDVLESRAATATGEADLAWIRSVQGYVLANLGDDRAALAVLQRGSEPWVAPVVAQVMRRLGDRDGADRLCREIWGDATRSAVTRAAAAIYVGEAVAGEQLLDRAPPDPTDDPHDVAAVRVWLRAAQRDWDGAERWFAAALDAIRVPRQVAMIAAELRDAVALLGGGDGEAAGRAAEWQRRIDERARAIDVGPGAITAERARAERLLAGTRHAGFSALTALREARKPGSVAAAAARLRASTPGLGEAVIASVAGAWAARGDAALAAHDGNTAAELYARAAALADSAALRVRRAWLAASGWLSALSGPAAAVPAAEPITAELEAAVGELVDQLPVRRAWLAIAALERAGRDTGNAAWAQLAGVARGRAARALDVAGSPSPPAPVVLEIPRDAPGPISTAWSAAQSELSALVGFRIAPAQVRDAAGALRILIDGLAAPIAPAAGGAATAGDRSAIQAALHAAGAIERGQLPRWIDVDRANQAIASWGGAEAGAASEPVPGAAQLIVPGTGSWYGEAGALPVLLAVLQAAARERIPSRAVGEALVRGGDAPSVYQTIRRARAACHDWLRERVLAGRTAVPLLPAIEAAVVAEIERDPAGLDRGAVVFGPDRRSFVDYIWAAARDRAGAFLVARDPRVRFAVALIAAARPGFVPVVSEEEQLG